MYGKIFTSIYDSTLAEDWRALVTFQQFIVLCDSDGVVDMTPPVISRRTNIPIDIIEAGIKFLEQPDPYSRTPDENGARIKRLDEHRNWAWQIVNHEKYLKLTSYEKVKAQNRERQQRYREKQKDNNVTNVTVTDGNAKSRHIDKDEDKNINKTNQKKGFKKPSLLEVQNYIIEKSYQVDAESFINFYESNGWKVGKNPMKNWKAALTTWQKRNGANNNENNQRANQSSRKPSLGERATAARKKYEQQIDSESMGEAQPYLRS